VIRFERRLMAVLPIGMLLVFASGLISFFRSPIDLKTFGAEFFSLITLHSVRLTIGYTVIALCASFFIAHLILPRLSRFLRVLLRSILVLPGFAYALLVLMLFRWFGVEDRYSMNSVFLAWVMAGVPYLVLMFDSAKQDLDAREKEALATLGARPLQQWWHHDFKRTWPAQSAALFQQFWLYLTSFSLVMILGGGPPNETLEVAIYTSVRLDRVNLTRALAVATWQVLILLGLKLSFGQRMPRSGLEWKARVGRSRVVFSSQVIFALSLLAGLWMLWVEVRDFMLPLIWSLFLGVSVWMGCFVYVISCYRSGLRELVAIGAWTSPMLLSLMIWNRFGFEWPSFIGVLILQVFMFSPWVSRTLYPLLDRTRKVELEAASTLGAKPMQAWLSLEWPRVRPAVLQVSGLVFSFSLMEVTSVMLFSNSGFETLSSHTQNLFSRFQLGSGAVGMMILLILSMFILRVSEELS